MCRGEATGRVGLTRDASSGATASTERRPAPDRPPRVPAPGQCSSCRVFDPSSTKYNPRPPGAIARPKSVPAPVESSVLAEAMRAYQSGDASAFDRLYAGLGPVLRRYLQALARDPARADDLVQEAFLQIHRARRTYNPERPVIPWALAIARHVFLMDCRTRRRKHDAADVEFDEAVEGALLGQERGPDEAVIAREQVRQALSTLTPGTRRVVLLHHVQGWSFREIAARLGINAAAAKWTAAELCLEAGLVVEEAWEGMRERPLRRKSSEMMLLARKEAR